MTLSIGLVGAGPWAQLIHAPMLEASPLVDFAAVWARRPEQAETLATRHHTRRATTTDEVFATCDAVVFAVPPDVQAALAVRAADAGCHLLLEKPLGLTLDQADAVVDAVKANGVVTQMMFTHRYRPSVQAFLAAASTFEVHGARAAGIGGAAIEGEFFATPWRIQHGALLDMGPHLLDLVDAAVGPIEDVSSTGDPTRWVQLTCQHLSGAVSEASLSITTPIDPSIATVDLFGPAGHLGLDLNANADDFGAAFAAVLTEFADAITSGRPHPLDAEHGRRIQQLIHQAATNRIG